VIFFKKMAITQKLGATELQFGLMGSRIIGWKLFWHQCYLDLQDLRPFRF
jgi:hypothetical protein